ncbi:Deoxyuridine 5'-triphosphate nucleotidohydrolase [Chitinispirillum alkaliphilum]|nr:Deoxyuridine 5'-triphosphate nucleotidohydrolase [Chitinispirillum alkaliphilum]
MFFFLLTSGFTMTNNYISVKRLDHAATLPLPCRMTKGSSGCDISAAINDEITLEPGSRALIPTGLCFNIPQGYEIQVRPRSGLAYKYGITVLNAPGTIDSDYRGEVKVILANLGEAPFVVRRGDRIAQLVAARVMDIEYEEESYIPETTRGSGGFGHTGL